MNIDNPSPREHSLYEESFAHYPHVAEQMVLTAVRTWLRPTCGAVRRGEDWRDILTEAGISSLGINCFDMLMCSLSHASGKPLDMRCRCATDLAKDEASLLQTVALLQITCDAEATQLLDAWLPHPTVSTVIKNLRWVALALLDAGLVIRVRARRVTYLH
ncbi:hypothetical protein [Paraburkholderia sp.]|uniref:hypothetical protein n=1 Tax=Paraburkholderia sp. TaxID=1926495 RepID=UPI0023849E54|nr:hypothetical protein [Paraburkholderia sp.]MDE1179055.1 hypothetical protein [Paraburkholderia sp.]